VEERRDEREEFGPRASNKSEIETFAMVDPYFK
jgi:hypothetical protein